MDKLTLDVLLAHSCSNSADIEGDWNEYVIDLHCVRVTVIARPTGDVEYPYEIHSYKMEDN